MKAVLEAIRQLHGCDDLDELAAAARAVRLVVTCDNACYTEVNAARGRAVHHTGDRGYDSEIVRLNAVYERFVHQHPLVAAAVRDPEPVLKWSDVVTLREFRDTALHREFFRPLGANRQIGVCLSATADLAVGVALNRSGGRDFGERDRARLALLRPHLIEAYRGAAVRADLRGRVGRSGAALAALGAGLLTVDAAGRIRSADAAALAAFAAVFPGKAGVGDVLPGAVRAWLAAAVGLAGRPDRPGAVTARAEFAGASGMLAVRLLGPARSGEVSLLVRAPATGDPIERLHRDGLTRREAEVLHRLTLGETNKEAAAALGLRPGTVRTHVERVLAKLGASNRSAAVRMALTRLEER